MRSDDIVVFEVLLAFFVLALLAAFFYIRVRWSQHVHSNSTALMATVRRRKATTNNHDGPPVEEVLISYGIAGQYYGPEEWFCMNRKGVELVPIYVLAETPTQPIIRQHVLES